MPTSSQLPESLKGRVVDADTHFQMNLKDVRGLFGDYAGDLAEGRLKVFEDALSSGKGNPLESHSGKGTELAYAGGNEIKKLDEHTAWRVKGSGNPGSVDKKSRLEIMNIMGVKRQLVFPDVVMCQAAWANNDRARVLTREYNDYFLDWVADDLDRLRPACIINMSSVEGAVEEAHRILKQRTVAFTIPSYEAPAGLSPSDPMWDPFWALLAEANASVNFHIGSSEGYDSQKNDYISMFGDIWGSTLKRSPLPEVPDEPLSAFDLSVTFLPVQIYLSDMILGGVLERHPNLRLGAIELAAGWVAPMAEVLDQRVKLFSKRMSSVISMTPSEYLVRNFRVTPGWWEPTSLYIERYGLEEIYMFSTDFPHPEGGTQPHTIMYDDLAPFGDSVIEKVFVTNADLLMPT